MIYLSLHLHVFRRSHAILLGEAFGEIAAIGKANGIHHLGNTELALAQELEIGRAHV